MNILCFLCKRFLFRSISFICINFKIFLFKQRFNGVLRSTFKDGILEWCHSENLNFHSWEEAFWFVLSNKDNCNFNINLIIFSQCVIIVVLLFLARHISQPGSILFSDVVKIICLLDNFFF